MDASFRWQRQRDMVDQVSADVGNAVNDLLTVSVSVFWPAIWYGNVIDPRTGSFFVSERPAGPKHDSPGQSAAPPWYELD